MARAISQLADVLEKTVAGLESGQRIRESLALAYWEHVVGPQAAAATQADFVREGILFVNTKSSVWSHEMTFLKAHVLKELNRRIGRPVIKEIIFRARGVEPRPQPREASQPDLDTIELSYEDQADLDKLIAGLTIEDDLLRNRIATRLTRDRKQRTWMLANGWIACLKCSSLHRSNGLICDLCRFGV